ncbi:MAG TPA: hypothetical protein VFX98_16525 [Longimicrobiaceae bacterium]|nr:hypothetical protein [Longimicrobiaceae bacterium]
MPAPDLRASAGEFRRAAAAAVAERSLRGVAAEIGMSAPGLQHFLDGGAPFRRTLRKLAAWYALRGAARGYAPEAALNAALALLLEGLPEEGRAEAGEEVLAVLRRHYARFGQVPPGGGG